MSWKRVKLKDICLSISDGDHQAPPKSKKGIPFVTISNITKTNQFDFSNTMFVPQEYYDGLDSKRKAKKGDILYSVVGSFGIPVYVQDGTPFVFQRHIAILKLDTEKIVPRFLYYTMLNRDFYMKADAAAIGAAQRTISLTALRNMEIEIPNIETQDKITKILSVYDNLIENNQKQIKLLEEAAQRLYKEWFVDLRFPGYEDTPIVDGVPEGWKKAKINDVFQIKYGKTLPKNKIFTTGTYPVYGANGVIGYYNEKNCDEYVVLITSRGNGSGDILRTHDKESFVTNNAFIVKSQFEYMKIPFIHQLMKHTDFKSICTGSAQPQLTNNSIISLVLMIPSKEIIEMFCNNMIVFYDRVEWLLSQNKLLIEARDRLLPKLMGGEIEV